MITNQQILEILHTWPIKQSCICNDNVKIQFNSPDKMYIAEFSKHKLVFNNTNTLCFELYETDAFGIDKIIYSKDIPNEIQLEIEYLMTEKAKKYVKTKIIEAFTNNEYNNTNTTLMN